MGGTDRVAAADGPPFGRNDRRRVFLVELEGRVVSTRGELVARMFFDHYAPRLMDGAAVGSDGWFAPSSPAGPPRGNETPA